MQFFFQPRELCFSLANDLVQIVDETVFCFSVLRPLVLEEGWQGFKNLRLPFMDLRRMDFMFARDLIEGFLTLYCIENHGNFLSGSERFSHGEIVPRISLIRWSSFPRPLYFLDRKIDIAHASGMITSTTLRSCRDFLYPSA